MLKRLALWLCRVAGVRPNELPYGYDLGPNVWLDADEADLSADGLKLREEVSIERAWLLTDELARIGIPKVESIEQSRLHGGTDAVERGQRWESFYRESGGLADMLTALRAEAFEAAAEAGVRDDQTRLAWLLQDRAYRRLQNKIEAVVISGKTELARREQGDRDKALRLVRHDF